MHRQGRCRSSRAGAGTTLACDRVAPEAGCGTRLTQQPCSPVQRALNRSLRSPPVPEPPTDPCKRMASGLNALPDDRLVARTARNAARATEFPANRAFTASENRGLLGSESRLFKLGEHLPNGSAIHVAHRRNRLLDALVGLDVHPHPPRIRTPAVNSRRDQPRPARRVELGATAGQRSHLRGGVRAGVGRGETRCRRTDAARSRRLANSQPRVRRARSVVR